MLDFIEGSIPTWYKFLFLLLYVVAWSVGIERITNLPKISRINVNLFLIFFVLFSVFYCLSGDYFQYEEWVKYKYDRDIWFKEQIYLYIIRFVRYISVEYAYDLFRLIIWGGALMLYYQCTPKNIKESYLSLLFLFLLYFVVFSYARASLAMAIYFYGVYILSTEIKFYKGIGILIILSSVLFHTEMFVAVAITPIVMFSLEKKNAIFHSVIFMGIVFVGLSYLSSTLSIFDSFAMDDHYISGKVDEMNEVVSSGRWSSQSIGQYIGYMLFYIPFVAILRIVFSNNRNYVFPTRILFYYRLTFAIIMVSTALAIIFGFGTVFHYRTLNMCIMPLSLLLAYFYQHKNLSRNYVKFLLGLAAFYQITKLFLRLLE